MEGVEKWHARASVGHAAGGVYQKPLERTSDGRCGMKFEAPLCFHCLIPISLPVPIESILPTSLRCEAKQTDSIAVCQWQLSPRARLAFDSVHRWNGRVLRSIIRLLDEHEGPREHRSNVSDSRLILSFVAVLLAVGCGKGDSGRRPVSGQIRGAEGRSGIVSLVPKDSRRGFSVRAKISNGRFEFDTQNGPVPGPHTVLLWLDPQEPVTTAASEKRGLSRDEAKDLMTERGEPQTLQVTVPTQPPYEVSLTLP